MALKRAAGMNDNAARSFDRLLVKLTGLSICSHGTTLGALTNGNMPNFTFKKMNVALKDQIREMRVFIVDSVVEYICSRLQKLF